jgi:hypothetical protein
MYRWNAENNWAANQVLLILDLNLDHCTALSMTYIPQGGGSFRPLRSQGSYKSTKCLPQCPPCAWAPLKKSRGGQAVMIWGKRKQNWKLNIAAIQKGKGTHGRQWGQSQRPHPINIPKSVTYGLTTLREVRHDPFRGIELSGKVCMAAGPEKEKSSALQVSR